MDREEGLQFTGVFCLLVILDNVIFRLRFECAEENRDTKMTRSV